MPDRDFPVLEIRKLGSVRYEMALQQQRELASRRRVGDIPDQLLLLEHPHVLTLGSSSREEHVLLSPAELERRGIETFAVGRGGDVTYHGPGQLVGYPILSLSPDRKDLHRYLRDLEEVLILTLAHFGIPAFREEGLTGVWCAGGKVAAIGVRVSSGWITSHGFALNVDPDLSYFSSIVPCGIQDRPVTSMKMESGGEVRVEEVMEPLVKSFGRVFQRRVIVV